MWVVIMAACIPPTMPYLKKVRFNVKTAVRSLQESWTSVRGKGSEYHEDADQNTVRNPADKAEKQHGVDDRPDEPPLFAEELKSNDEARGAHRMDSDASKSTIDEFS